MTLQLRRGTNLERQSVILREGELVYVTDTKGLYVGDGTTLGGVAVGSGPGLGGSLSSNLNLNGFEITGLGDIDITGTITATAYGGITLDTLENVNVVNPSDGEILTYVNGNWVNLPGPIPGSNYNVSIIGNDSTVIVDANTNTVTGFFNGDLQGSLFRDDSSTLIDGVNGVFYTEDLVHYGDSLKIRNFSDGLRSVIDITTIDEISRLSLKRESLSPIDDTMVYGRVDFTKADSLGTTTKASIGADNLGLFFIYDPLGISTTESSYIVFSNENNLGIGSFDPQTKLEIKNGSLRFNDTRTIASILTPIEGEMTYETNANTLTFYNGAEWRNVVSSSATSGVTSLSGSLRLANFTTTQRNSLTPSNGDLIYNTTVNKIQGYQNGSWINLDDGSIG